MGYLHFLGRKVLRLNGDYASALARLCHGLGAELVILEAKLGSHVNSFNPLGQIKGKRYIATNADSKLVFVYETYTWGQHIRILICIDLSKTTNLAIGQRYSPECHFRQFGVSHLVALVGQEEEAFTAYIPTGVNGRTDFLTVKVHVHFAIAVHKQNAVPCIIIDGSVIAQVMHTQSVLIDEAIGITVVGQVRLEQSVIRTGILYLNIHLKGIVLQGILLENQGLQTRKLGNKNGLIVFCGSSYRYDIGSGSVLHNSDFFSINGNRFKDSVGVLRRQESTLILKGPKFIIVGKVIGGIIIHYC